MVAKVIVLISANATGKKERQRERWRLARRLTVD
jgi:hypothetical protein